MSPNKRIALNIIATYGRSLYQLVIGLLCGRWSLMALGTVDYGLNGVVGGMTAFFTFINMSFDASIARFYAFAVGEASVANDASSAMDNCRKWFTIAVVLHTVMPLLAISVGYPLGVWAVRDFLTIPPDRVQDCVWVFRFVCLSCLLHMMTCPFSAMYRAKQYIAELTIYTVVTVTLNVVFLYYMISHPGVWLKGYALWSCVLSVLPQLIIAVRAVVLFQECRFVAQHVFAWSSYRKLFAYIGWNIFGDFIYMMRGQGIAVLVNKYFGPSVNAAMGVATTVNGHTLSLASSMRGAFQPAIVTACGAGDYDRMHSLVYRTCKLGLVFSLIFIIPLSLELREIMRLWLVTPPKYVVEFCWCMMGIILLEQATSGLGIAISAKGKIAKYSFWVGFVQALGFPLAWIGAVWIGNPICVIIALGLTMIGVCILRLHFARTLVDLSIWYWFSRVAVPILFVVVVIFALCLPIQVVLSMSFTRIVITTSVCECLFLLLIWGFFLDSEEKKYVKSGLMKILGRCM